MKDSLLSSERAVLQAIKDLSDDGTSPTISEIAIYSNQEKGTVAKIRTRLRKYGFLTYQKGKFRSTKLTGKEWS